MAYGLEHGVHDLAWTGTRAGTGDTAPGFGTWEVQDHEGCAGNGMLQALARGDELPPCPVCGAPVTWQLSHLAASVAADHRGVGHLP